MSEEAIAEQEKPEAVLATLRRNLESFFTLIPRSRQLATDATGFCDSMRELLDAVEKEDDYLEAARMLLDTDLEGHPSFEEAIERKTDDRLADVKGDIEQVIEDLLMLPDARLRTALESIGDVLRHSDGPLTRERASVAIFSSRPR